MNWFDARRRSLMKEELNEWDFYRNQYLTFEALEDSVFSYTLGGDVGTDSVTSMSYSTDDGVTWNTTENTSSSVTITTPTITAGNKVLWKGVATRYGDSTTPDTSKTGHFSSTGSYRIFGNIKSLLYDDNFLTYDGDTEIPEAAFYGMFYQSTTLKNAKNLILEFKYCPKNALVYFFNGCTNLESTPLLPFTSIFSDGSGSSRITGISNAFKDCSNINYFWIFDTCYGLGVTVNGVVMCSDKGFERPNIGIVYTPIYGISGTFTFDTLGMRWNGGRFELRKKRDLSLRAISSNGTVTDIYTPIPPSSFTNWVHYGVLQNAVILELHRAFYDLNSSNKSMVKFLLGNSVLTTIRIKSPTEIWLKQDDWRVSDSEQQYVSPTSIEIKDLKCWVESTNYAVTNISRNLLTLNQNATLILNNVDIRNSFPNQISEGITKIGASSLNQEINFSNGAVTLPTTLQSIGENAFYGNTSLTSVSFTDSNIIALSAGNEFAKCSQLTSLYFSSNSKIADVPSSTFSDCSSLSTIIVDSGNTTIRSEQDACLIRNNDNTLLLGTKNLTSIPNTVVNLIDSCFVTYPDALKQLVIPNSVQTIGEYVFSNKGITSITFGNGLTSIANYAFCNNTSLASNPLVLPDSLVTIGEHAFKWCQNINGELTIPNNVTSIGYNSFRKCTKITSLNIGTSLSSIGTQSFAECYSLASIGVSSQNTTYDSRDNCNAIIETATNTLIVACKNTTIPNTVTAIGSYAFGDSYAGSARDWAVNNYTFPSNVVTIEDRAFQKCTSITGSLSLSNITSLGQYAFSGCTGITSLNFGNSLTILPSYVFSGCTSLSGQLTIPNYITTVDSYAFQNCNNLTSLIIGTGMKNYDSTAFSGCTRLTSVIWNVTELDNFYCATSNSAWPASVTSITIGSNVTKIPYNFCNKTTGITSITIPNSVTSIRGHAFDGCTGLNSIVIGTGITLIGDSATSNTTVFLGCTNLSSIQINATTPPTLSKVTCGSIPSTTTIYVPSSAVSTYKSATNWSTIASQIQAIS